ncbi:MAG: antitermination protein NusB, partial [Candidatus Sulfotelmatobacter sp.]
PFARPFDRILVDAPCSGTGTLARHPEIRWRLHAEQFPEFHALQVAMLSSALKQLAPGGRLVYSTCSMEPEENEKVVGEALAAAPEIKQVVAKEIANTLMARTAPGIDPHNLIDPTGQFRISPADHKTDGFFAAVLTKS